MPTKPEIQQQLLDIGIGVLLTPYSQRKLPSPQWTWAADNGCFGKTWERDTWQTWLDNKRTEPSPLFATVPDVVADHTGTMERWKQYAPIVKGMGYRTAFVLQDGATTSNIPLDDFDALFIGGSTQFKLSQEARTIVRFCKDHDKWVHMGRVNSKRRIQIAYQWGCDSVDGTYLAFSPDANTPRLIKMMTAGTQPTLFESITTTNQKEPTQ